MNFHWLSTLWFGYFWPSLKGNGPEALIQSLVYGFAGYLIGNIIHDKIEELHEHLHHVSNHIGIPLFDRKASHDYISQYGETRKTR